MPAPERHYDRPEAQDASREARLRVLERQLTPRRQQRLEEALHNRVSSVTMVVDGVYDLGNASAIMRTCEGLGIHKLFFVEPTVSLKTSRRSSQGSHKWLSISRFATPVECAQAVRAAGYRIFGASLEAEDTLDTLDLSSPIAIVVGAEKEGLSKEMLAECDGFYRIPMRGLVQSFNVSVAAAMTLFEIMQRRRRELHLDGDWGDMAPEELDAVREIFYRKSVQYADRILERELGVAPPSMPEPDSLYAELD
ncbi:MAG: TrmH family RNA methyltransferase [Deltaproteobacteria bacterium CG_4_9_14_3_um_filter_63_12]|nr:MAG: TrmH family RNA methyltransferase [Deltaproteobacteria bacterium CG17_big_fil_post_rev_8_21_14_2_50_63_7]PJB39488.1 MAG: TrmH family RNA methyltransferase [Deltaproteobacteria bacterium CG_4_9_14_3_um_filter_63_12]